MNNESRKVYTLVTKDQNVWKRSSSGGAFTEICKAWDDGNCIFVGAAWDGLDVHHICVDSVDKISILCKSKYVSSKMGNVFKEVKSYLIGGKRVVFCGTPCQVEGLKLYLGKEYDQLLLIDLICHGVGSQKVFHECLNQTGIDFKGEVIRYEFRTKRKVWEMDYLIRIDIKRHKKIHTYYLEKDRYMQLFLNQNALRKSCSNNCCFRSEKRAGDITIADAKGILEIYPELVGTKKNYSSVIINNDKGEKVISGLEKTCFMYTSNIENIKRYNPLFYRHTFESKERDAFFKDFVNDSNKAINKWTMIGKIKKINIFRFVYLNMPVRLRKLFQIFKGRIYKCKKKVC